jgi:PncC family amidohydrolase
MNASSLEMEVGQLLTRYHLTLALAESCTGGLVGHRLTNVPGSSAYFLGGVMAYAYDAKEQVLGVNHDTLYEHGAVSEPVAREMAQRARQLFRADIGLAITGIAGPGGGSPDKPVGLTWIALSAHDADLAASHIWPGDREANKAASAEAALTLLKNYLVQLIDRKL